MESTDSFETTLRTCITLTSRNTPPQSISIFASGKPEETLPFPPSLVDGRLDAVQTGRGLGIIHTAFTSGEQPFVATIHSPNRPMRFSFTLSQSPTSVSIAGERRAFRVAGGQSTLLSVPSALVNAVPPHHRFHNFCILVDESLVESCLGEVPLPTASGLIKAMEKNRDPYSHISLITPSMQMVLQQIFSSAYRGSLRKFYLQAKCMELVTMRIDQLCQESEVRNHPPLRRVDIEHIHEARDLLRERIDDPPSLQEIATTVGINCNKLKYGFREIFGTTVFGYLRTLRLEEARRLLKAGDHSVTEVAFQVGYSSLSHFALLFKQTYGVSPQCYARQSLSTELVDCTRSQR
ncbi:MAG: AraC family transcriptional regulator [Spirochaetia bacterium]